LIRIPVEIIQPEIVVFTKNVNFQVQGVESLRPYEIGIERGFKSTEYATEGMNVYKVSSVIQQFKMLDKGKVDIVLQTRLHGLYIL